MEDSENIQLTTDELAVKVAFWAFDKGIIKSLYDFDVIRAQFKKLREEVDELEEEADLFERAVLRSSDAVYSINDVKLELGDCLVVLTVLAENHGLTLQECLEAAYNKIKNRKGKTVNGQFVKESV